LLPGGGVNFDLAWKDSETIVVAEIKSITAKNESRQLRLGLGQVLDYRSLLATDGRDVSAVLAVERKPTEQRWIGLCESVGVTLVWPETFVSLF
jgi:hypothetical protein